MNKKISYNLGIIFGAIAAIGTELLGGASAEETAAPGNGEAAGGDAPAKRRGRPPGSGAAAETPAGGAAAPTGGKTYEELREVIKPLVEEGKGEDVKKLIAKHGGTKLADLPAANHAAFIKDIEALSY